jgi:glycosyltransferase involved in cell wall biosynthesis
MAKKSTSNNKKLDKVSVITTFYNAEKFVLDAINSVNQQIIDGFELEYVIVDDKSPDGTRAKIEQFINDHVKNKESWRIVEPEENLGCGGARKFGIDNAAGDYFMFLDADDYYLHRDFIYRAYNEIKKNKADIVEFGMIMNQPNGQQMNNTSNQRIVIENDPDRAVIALFKDNLIKFNVWCKIYTREIVESYPYSTSRTYEDVRTIPVWCHNANKIIIMPTPEVNYRAASGSIIRDDMVKTRVGTITAIAELFPRFNHNYQVMRSMYSRAMVDLEALLHNHSSNDPGFNEMSRLNTYMLSFLLQNYKDVTYHVEDDPELQGEENTK